MATWMLSLLSLAAFAVVATPQPGGQAYLGDDSQRAAEASSTRTFTLRHIYHHGSHTHPNIHRFVDVALPVDDSSSIQMSTVSMEVQRLPEYEREELDEPSARPLHGGPASPPMSAWITEQILGPNVSDKETVLSAAKMAANAYLPGNGSDWKWQDIGKGFNYTDDFGWEDDGLRGHIFVDEADSTLVISLKGTSVRWLDDPDTAAKDFVNDNIFGSCCCAEGVHWWWWQPACYCQTAAKTCNSTCLARELQTKGHYYPAAQRIYQAVVDRYPGYEVWLVGHSLGGVVSSLLGLTYGRPALTFEAYPDALAASRLGLPTPPGHKIGVQGSGVPLTSHIYHYGHTADPIYMGACDALFSSCTLWGFSLQSRCHTGRRCVYDTKQDLGWNLDVRTHSIDRVIEEVLQKYDQVPACHEDVDCSDCAEWKFFDGNATITSTSTAPTSTTQTCKTPGWWGCRDEDATTTAADTSRSHNPVQTNDRVR